MWLSNHATRGYGPCCGGELCQGSRDVRRPRLLSDAIECRRDSLTSASAYPSRIRVQTLAPLQYTIPKASSTSPTTGSTARAPTTPKPTVSTCIENATELIREAIDCASTVSLIASPSPRPPRRPQQSSRRQPLDLQSKRRDWLTSNRLDQSCALEAPIPCHLSPAEPSGFHQSSPMRAVHHRRIGPSGGSRVCRVNGATWW